MPRGRTKPSPLVVGTLTPSSCRCAPRSDRDSIVRTIETYIRAWFSGDARAMEQCFHPELTRRVMQLENPVEEGHADGFSIQGIQSTLGPHTHPLDRDMQIQVLDVSPRSASARAQFGNWAAYMHLAVAGGAWSIVNILWEWRSLCGGA